MVERRLVGEPLREAFARRLGGDAIFETRALIAQRLEALLERGRSGGSLGTWRPCVDRPDDHAGRGLALDASEAGSRPGGKSRAISVVSPLGRSTRISRVTVAPSG